MKKLSVLLLILASQAQAADPCISARAAIDIGSGSTKARSFIVNTCWQTIIKQVDKVSAKIAWKQELSRNGGKISPEFLNTSTQTIIDLSNKLKASTIEKLKSDPQYSYLANSPIRFAGVATEWFRQTQANDPTSATNFLTTLNKIYLNVRGLSQKEEGRLGFIGVMALSGVDSSLPANANDYLSWDIGGASLQIVAYTSNTTGENPWTEFGNQLASDPMRCFVLEKVQSKSCFEQKVASTPNPLLAASYADKSSLLIKSQDFVSGQFESMDSKAPNLRGYVQGGIRKLVGIGGVHGSVIETLRQLPNHEDATGYSTTDLEILIDKLSVLTDDDLIQNYKASPAFVSGVVSNALMVYSVMKSLNVSFVRVADVDNTLGVAVAPSYWGKNANNRRPDGQNAINP